MAGCARLGRNAICSTGNCSRQISLQLTFRCFSKKSKLNIFNNESYSRKLATTASLVALAGSYFAYKRYVGNLPSLLDINSLVLAKDTKDDPQEKQPSFRELRFTSFASVEYQGHVFMTPRDFLESITYDNPRYRAGRLKLSKAGVDKLLKATPTRGKSLSNMFRNLGEQGLISYTEYLFLLCILTKPKSGFKIAFNMFDVDGDEKVDKKEFLVLEQLLAHAEKSGVESPQDLVKELKRRQNLWDILQESADGVVFAMKKLCHKMKSYSEGGHKRAGPPRNIWYLIKYDNKSLLPGYYIEPITDTTLTVHFFGTKGRDVMNYEDFHRFMDNLQTEVLELEFAEFSCGLPTITEIEFAQILVRYTKLTKEENDRYLNRLRNRIEHSQGITFKEFKEFCQFLNCIDDFSLAMRIYTYADHPISEADFTRAVKSCTGQTLNNHLIHVVFQLFDVDGDGRLSHKEFISVMKERIHRGAKHSSNTRWDNFKGCVKNEIKCN